MKDTIIFSTKLSISPETNVSNFINFCRYQLNAFGKELDWESPVWKGFVTFKKVGKGNYRIKKEDIMHDDYIDFAKAYLRYQQFLKPVKNYGNIMIALRCLEMALLKMCRNAFIYNISVIVLDEAMQIAKQFFHKNTVIKCGFNLEELAKFVSDNRMAKSEFIEWKYPERYTVKQNYLSMEKNKDRQKKLPNESALFAIAGIFSKPDSELNDRDLFTTSVFALLMCAPCRISEILALSADCEITQTDSYGIERYGLRFFSLKGYGANIKWIPTVMVPVAKKAISRLLKLSENARALAKWYEKNPDKFYHLYKCDSAINEKEPLSAKQICHAIGYTFDKTYKYNRKIKIMSYDDCKTFLNPSNGYYTLNTLWHVICSNFPADFPWYDKEKSIKYSNALCLLNVHQCDKTRLTIYHKLFKPNKDFFCDDISAKKQKQKLNIFARYGFYDNQEKPLFIRSHQPRHLLNTMAHYGELSELDTAKWSGRVSVRSNGDYNHVTQEQMVEKVKALNIPDKPYGMEISANDKRINTAQKLEEVSHGAVHITQKGYCIHDYLIPPCKKITAYLESEHNSSECSFIGMDRDTAIKLRIKILALINITKLAVVEGEYGADKWLDHHELNLKIINKIINK